MSNLVPLCHKCHQRLHNNESYEAGRIILIRGLAWLKKLSAMKDEYVKTDIYFYRANFQRLQEMLGV